MPTFDELHHLEPSLCVSRCHQGVEHVPTASSGGPAQSAWSERIELQHRVARSRKTRSLADCAYLENNGPFNTRPCCVCMCRLVLVPGMSLAVVYRSRASSASLTAKRRGANCWRMRRSTFWLGLLMWVAFSSCSNRAFTSAMTGAGWLAAVTTVLTPCFYDARVLRIVTPNL